MGSEEILLDWNEIAEDYGKLKLLMIHLSCFCIIFLHLFVERRPCENLTKVFNFAYSW